VLLMVATGFSTKHDEATADCNDTHNDKAALS
jgi:hypothetical protein